MTQLRSRTAKVRRTTRASDQRVKDNSAEARIGSRIQVKSNGCWIYNDDPDTYGHAYLDGRQHVTVHRWVYETLVGPLDSDVDLHHECETPGCVNPAHLTPLTRSEHQRHHAQIRRQL